MKEINRTLFISRIINRDIPEWIEIESLNWKIVDLSLLKITPIEFSLSDNFDWLFFSSKNAVRSFFKQLSDNQVKLVSHKKIASIGSATANEIKTFTKQIDYIGDGLFKNKTEFLSHVGQDETILFPLAVNSRRYPQKQIGEDRKMIDLPVYNNEPQNVDLPRVDIALMTSPMNVTSFLENYKYPAQGIKFISVGPATSKMLRRKNLKIQQTMSEPKESVWAKETFEYIVDHYR